MFKFKKILLAGVFLMSTTANATVIVDTVNQNKFVGWGGSHTYTHYLTDNGFIPGTTVATGGSIKIQFSDDANDSGWLGSMEKILIVVDAFDFDTGGVIGSATSFFNGIETNALAQINSAGMLNITIQSLLGDFYVGKSVLSIHTGDVPAPPILGILSLGLLGIGVAGRIKTGAKQRTLLQI